MKALTVTSVDNKEIIIESANDVGVVVVEKSNEIQNLLNVVHNGNKIERYGIYKTYIIINFFYLYYL